MGGLELCPTKRKAAPDDDHESVCAPGGGALVPAPKKTIVECKVICKNITGADIFSVSRSLPLADLEQHTPHGEVQQTLVAKGEGCVRDVFTEAIKRIGAGEVRKHHYGTTEAAPGVWIFHRGLWGGPSTQSSTHFEQGTHQLIVPLFGLLGASGSENRMQYDFRSGMAEGFEATYDGGVISDVEGDQDFLSHCVSARLVIRDTRIHLMFVLREAWFFSGDFFGEHHVDEYEVRIEPDEDGNPKGCLPLREDDATREGVSWINSRHAQYGASRDECVEEGEICGLKLEPRLLHESPGTNGGARLRPTPVGLVRPWEFVFANKARAAAAWSAIQRACSLLHEIDSDPTRLLSHSPSYQKFTPGMILSAAFAPSRITFVLDRGNSDGVVCDDGASSPDDASAALGPADTFGSLRKIAESAGYRELHEVQEETALEYHLYAMVDTSRRE